MTYVIHSCWNLLVTVERKIAIQPETLALFILPQTTPQSLGTQTRNGMIYKTVERWTESKESKGRVLCLSRRVQWITKVAQCGLLRLELSHSQIRPHSHTFTVFENLNFSNSKLTSNRNMQHPHFMTGVLYMCAVVLISVL